MKASLYKIWSVVGLTGLIAAVLWGNLAYMNLRSADPILPGWEEYSPNRFSELMARGEPVLVEVYASWCPTCLLQHRAFENLQETTEAPLIRSVRIDFDRDRDFIEAHGYTSTGLLVIFQRGQVVAEASGLVTAEAIEQFIASYWRL